MSRPESSPSSRRVLWACLLALALGAGLWFASSGDESSAGAAAEPDKDALPRASRAPAEHLAAPPANLPPPPDAGRAQDTHEAALMDTAAAPTPAPPVDDEPAQGDGDGPEEAPFAIPQVESRVEREMSFAEKAGQTRIMVTRVRERAERVEARLAEARQSGDADAVHLQEMLLMRLQRRTQQLTQQAAYEQQQAADEAQPPPVDQPPEQATSDAP